MTADVWLGWIRCPDCSGDIVSDGEHLRCTSCGRTFDRSKGYVDLRPSQSFTEQTKYLDESLHADARHESVSPPLLGSRVRHNMLRRLLQPAAGDRIVDLGCGSGRSVVWHGDSGATIVGIDISPFFAHDAIAHSTLLLGDLRRLPFKDRVFTKAWTLDVLEHLSPEALADVLREANRVLVPGGALFIYTHVRKNGPLAGGVRLVNRLARGLESIGLIDLTQERLRKSDHLNPLTDHDDLQRTMAAAGFSIERIVYYTPILGAFVENVLMRMAERALARRSRTRLAASPADPQADTAAVRAARTMAKARLERRGPLYVTLRGVSAMMMLDIALFGRFKSGPFFAVVRKT